jgi:2-oxoisovalerate dehydrogenase E2 component (dihydrolipoyl transacylase)
MGEQLVPAGEVVKVGEPLCEITRAGTAPDEKDSPNPAPQANPHAGQPPAPAMAAPVRPNNHTPEPRARFYSPAVLRLAREHEVDLEALSGSGIGGRVTRKDVEKAIAGRGSGSPSEQPAKQLPSAPRVASSGAAHRVEFTPTRRTIAERMQRSNTEAPQAWTMVEVEVTELVALRAREREAFQARTGTDLTLLPYFVAAACKALREHPALNARWEGAELYQHDEINIGIAVASPSGLVVPVVRDADQFNVAGLAPQIAALVERARTRRLGVEDITGGTFTVNNTGAFGSIASKPILNVPEVAIVTMERAVRRPVALDDRTIGIRWMMNVCLSFDHRAMDGSEAGAFLATLKSHLESP